MFNVGSVYPELRSVEQKGQITMTYRLLRKMKSGKWFGLWVEKGISCKEWFQMDASFHPHYNIETALGRYLLIGDQVRAQPAIASLATTNVCTTITEHALHPSTITRKCSPSMVTRRVDTQQPVLELVLVVLSRFPRVETLIKK